MSYLATSASLASVVGVIAVGLRLYAHLVATAGGTSSTTTGKATVAHLMDGNSIVGFLTSETPDAFVMKQARTLPGRDKILGEAVIPRDRVSWLQVDVPLALLED